MAPLTWQRLALVGAGSLAVAWLVTRVANSRGGTPATVPWSVAVFAVVASVAALWFGWQVRAFLKGDRPSLSPLRAARTAVFAQACAYVGAVLVGAYGGYALGLADAWSHGPRRDVIISALIAALAGAAMIAAGAIAERWCRHSDDDPPSQQPNAAAA